MKHANFSVRPSISVVLIFPAAIFFCFSLVKYQLGFGNPYDIIAPHTESSGIDQPVELEHQVADPASITCRLFVLAVGGK